MELQTPSDPQAALALRLEAALVRAFGDEYANTPPLIRESRFSDFQADVALSLAKPLRQNPRAIAELIVANLNVDGFSKPPSVSGPGYINFEILSEWIDAASASVAEDELLGVAQSSHETVVVDYSSPNVAKEMHVGHLRTTIVGDALARLLEATGTKVIRQNHIGDWGTPFGMLIEHLLELGEDSAKAKELQATPNAFYQSASARFKSDEAFAQLARERVVKLQAGDAESLEHWEKILSESKLYFNKIYSELGVSLSDEHLAGESRYNDELQALCDELVESGIASHSNGALCVFFPEYPTKDGSPATLIIRKSDGGYGYAATDLAALRYRAQVLKADRISYVVGAPQELHLKMVKSIALQAGWLSPELVVEHVAIGSVLGSDGKMLKSRSGEPVLLQSLLNEAISASEKSLSQREELTAVEQQELSKIIGMGAVKYADLSVSHETEYTFNLQRMLATHGNTGPYLQYAATRISSILTKAGVEKSVALQGKIAVGEEKEKALALKLLQFGAAVAHAGETTALHGFCAYLFELAQEFSGFYEACPILKAEDDEKESRLALAALTLTVLEQGLALLGIRVPAHM